MMPDLPIPIPALLACLLGLLPACLLLVKPAWRQSGWRRWLMVVTVVGVSQLAGYAGLGFQHIVYLPIHGVLVAVGLVLVHFRWLNWVELQAAKTQVIAMAQVDPKIQAITRAQAIIVSMLTLVAVLLCARAWFVIEFWSQLVDQSSLGESAKRIVDLRDGGLVLYGGVIGGSLVMIVALRRFGLSILGTADHLAPTLMLTLVIGRLGCWFNGCCYGAPSDLPWAMSQDEAWKLYLYGSHELNWHVHTSYCVHQEGQSGIVRHPSQLYEVFFGMFMYVALRQIARFPRFKEGMLAGITLAAYGLWRIINEGFRGDNPDLWISGWSASRWLSVLVVLGGTVLVFKCRQSASLGQPDQQAASPKEAISMENKDEC